MSGWRDRVDTVVGGVLAGIGLAFGVAVVALLVVGIAVTVDSIAGWVR